MGAATGSNLAIAGNIFRNQEPKQLQIRLGLPGTISQERNMA